MTDEEDDYYDDYLEDEEWDRMRDYDREQHLTLDDVKELIHEIRDNVRTSSHSQAMLGAMHSQVCLSYSELLRRYILISICLSCLSCQVIYSIAHTTISSGGLSVYLISENGTCLPAEFKANKRIS